jgi:hypothetical protein
MMEDSKMTIDIIKSIETQDAGALKDNVTNALNGKAFAKLEDMKKHIASSLLDAEEESTNEDV